MPRDASIAFLTRLAGSANSKGSRAGVSNLAMVISFDHFCEESCLEVSSI